MNIPKPWRLVKTPNPAELSFQTIHDPDDGTAWFTTTGDNGRPIPYVTLYQNWKRHEPKRAIAAYGGIWGDYLMTKVDIGEGGEVIYSWVKNKTDLEKYTPYQDPIPSSKPFGWDPILEEIVPIADYGSPRSGRKLINGAEATTNGPEYYAHVTLIAGGEYATRFLRYDYFAPTPFKIAAKPTPVPNAVIFMMPGREGIVIPRCLHKRIETPRLVTSFSQALDGAAEASGTSIPGQVFPSTAPFETWGIQIVEQDQREEGGGWHMWKVVAYPPAKPEATEQNFT